MLAPLKMYMLLMEEKNHDSYQKLPPPPEDTSPRCFGWLISNLMVLIVLRYSVALAKDREVSSSFYRAK